MLLKVKTEKVKKLIHHKRKGYLKIGDPMAIREEIGPEAVDTAQRLEEQMEVDPIHSEEQPELSPEDVGKTADPVFVYLQAMSSVPLLAREEGDKDRQRDRRGAKGSHRRGPIFPFSRQGDRPVWRAAQIEERMCQ